MTEGSRTRVLVVEDSPVVQQLLVYAIASDPRLEVAAVVGSGERALRVLDQVAADVVSLDIRLPGIDGFELTKRIMKQRPLPIVVVASDLHDLDIPMKALAAGALSVVEKPAGLARADYDAVARHLCTQLRIMSQVKVIRHRIVRNAGSRVFDPPPAPGGRPAVLGLVASTGGPNALAQVLGGLPLSIRLPILVVQHIGAPFVPGFAAWLDSVVPFPVTMARDGDPLCPGTVCVAPGGTHLIVADGRVRLSGGDPVCGQRPSGDRLLSALAAAYGPGALGVVLTGMGEDGARGLLDMRLAGGYTIAEHESTAVVHGMPGTAVRIGAAVEELPLDRIASRLGDLVTGSRRETP